MGLKTDIVTGCILNLCERTNVHIPNQGNQIVHIFLIREMQCALGNHSRLIVGEEAFSSFFYSKIDKTPCFFVLYLSNKQYFVNCNSLRLPRWRASCPLRLFLRRDMLCRAIAECKLFLPLRGWHLSSGHETWQSPTPFVISLLADKIKNDKKYEKKNNNK